MNLQTNFSDIFKSNFLEKASSFSIIDTLIILALGLTIGLFIFYVYKKTFKGVMYSESFGISLVAMTLITSVIIMAITSNVILSLGMVGALSIVRFRTAVKETLDIAFLFWSISVGIVLGAGLIPLAIIGSIFIGIFLLIFVNKSVSNKPYMLVLNADNTQSEEKAVEFISASVKKYVLKSKSISYDSKVELTVEVRLNDSSTTFINELNSISGISNVVLVAYNGEYMS
jgi:uncharacterized membrane protein YhiD involved in acid resistance